jgi:hypothetical protein
MDTACHNGRHFIQMAPIRINFGFPTAQVQQQTQTFVTLRM